MSNSALPAFRDALPGLAQTGAIYLQDPEAFISGPEWDTLERICFDSGLPYETVVVGDADEPNRVDVGRFMTDVEAPRKVNDALADEVLKIIGAPHRLEALAQLLGHDRLVIRRAQVNHMHCGSFVGLHLDQDSNPDYQISVVLQLGRTFGGGEFVIHLPEGTKTVVEPRYRSTTVSRCDYPHEVRPVTNGTRTSVVFFVAPHDGPNRRVRGEAAGPTKTSMLNAK